MIRRPARKVLAVIAVTAFAVTACGEKSTDGGGTGSDPSGGGTSASGELTIKPLEQVDIDGKKVESSGSTEAADPAGDGKAECTGVKLGFAGALSGPNAALGQNIRNGMQVAIKQHNDANAGCQVEVVDFDTEGDPNKASSVAPNIISDESVIGLLGPAFSGETKAVGGLFDQAGLVSVSASATNPDLTKNGWKTFFRGLANDAVQGPAVAAYIKDTLAAKKVYLIKDDSEYGKGLASTVKETLGDVIVGEGDVKTGAKEFSAIVTDVSSAAPDLVFYSGYYAEAAPLVQQLREGGVEAKFMSGDGSNDPQFVSGAGSSSDGAYLSCPCGPAPEEFAAEYAMVNDGAVPGTYSTEGYDLGTILLKGIDEGNTTREKLLEYVSSYDGQGLARAYKWDDTGELAEKLTWIYEVGG